jgi:hypothetical protein
MASGIIVGTKYIENGRYWIELHWSSSGSQGTNSSTVDVTTYFCSEWAVNFTASKNGNTSVNGSNLTWTSATDINHGTGIARTAVYTRSDVAVTHGADGKASITISGTYVPNVTISGWGTLGTMSASGTATLDSLSAISMKFWNGSNWTGGYVKVWNGSAWVAPKGIYVWNGSSWIQ